MDVEDAMTLSYEDFCARYMAPNRPVLLRKSRTRGFRRRGSGVMDEKLTLNEYLDLIENGTAGKKYLKDWHFVHAFGHDVYVWWDHKEKSESDYRFVYLDVFRSYSWSVNVCGRKKWVFYHPDDESKLKDRFGRLVVSDVTVGNIDKENYPHFHEAKPVYVIQETGDAIFVPSGWYHQVENLEDTISINHNWFNGYNVRELWDFFKKEYAAVELLYAKARELLEKREHPEDNSLAVAGSDLLTHLRYVRDILQELNAALKTVDEDAKEMKQGADAPSKIVFSLFSQVRPVLCGTCLHSFGRGKAIRRGADRGDKKIRGGAIRSREGRAEEQIAQLEESVKNCTSQMVDDLAELERLRASDASHEQQQAELQRQLDERDDRFAQLSAEYDTLRVQYDQLQQAQYDAQKTHEDALAAKQQDLTSSGNKEQLDEVNARVKGLEDELALLSLTGPGGNDYTARIRGLQQEVFVKSEQLVQQGEKHLRVAGLFDKTKSELVQLREEVGNSNTGMDDSLYQHVKLEELVRLRLKAFEHEWQLAGGPTPSSSTLDPATDEGQDSAESSSCHLANVENFSALDALGLGGVGRLEREMRVLRSRNKRLIERTERLESELDSAQAGLRDLQSMREKMVEMVGRERVEKELQCRAGRKSGRVGARARILEDQLRLMDEKFIDVRNKLDWTRSSARKENKQLSAELRSLRMKWQMESDAGALSGLPDWAPPVSVPKFSKKAPLGTSSSESRLPTPKASNNGLSPVVAAVVQDALAIGNGARVKFDIPKLPQPESDAVTLAVLLPPNSALSSPRDRGPLFNGSVVVRSLDVKGYEAILADSESVWVVDYYSSWCAHCRMFAPKWEKVGEFYHESKVVQVGAVDCNQHKDVCQREEVNMEVRGRKKAKPVVEWVEKLLAEHGIESGMDISTIVEETKLRRNDVDEEGGVLNDDTSIQMKYKRLRDAGKAAMLALENSFFIGTPVLEGERYAAALKWVNALADTFPVEGNRVAVAKLVDRVKTQRSWPLAEWNELIEKWRPTARETSFRVF
ncbi:Thioredoxin, conserved site [Phytophthora cactorum]|nr:Thioredoxin, conserved site [Phytophthora cactorum]